MIVIVGNRTNKYDCSDIVNSADLVIRVNKMCNLDSGTVGNRTDWVVLTPWSLYWKYSEAQRHWDTLKQARRIFLHPRDVNIRRSSSTIRNFKGMSWEIIPNGALVVCRRPTTTTLAVCVAHYFFPQDKLVLVGGDIGSTWIRARAWYGHRYEEAGYYDNMIARGILTVR